MCGEKSLLTEIIWQKTTLHHKLKRKSLQNFAKISKLVCQVFLPCTASGSGREGERGQRGVFSLAALFFLVFFRYFFVVDFTLVLISYLHKLMCEHKHVI